MDTKILPNKNGVHSDPKNFDLTGERVHTRGRTETAAPQHTRKEKHRELTWFACQAVRIDEEGMISFRSFPFFALSLAHAKSQLLEIAATTKEPLIYTHIFQYAALHEKSRKHAKCKIEKDSIKL